MQSLEQTVVVDGVEYNRTAMSAAARAQLGSIRAVELEIAHLHQKLSIAEAARRTFVEEFKRKVEQG